jgi:CubicO group peptidase (beta-lactamase class C family)
MANGKLAAACSILGLALLPAACAKRNAGPAGPTDPDRQRLQSFEQQAEQIRVMLKIPGLSAVIVRDQQVLWSKGFGFADVENQIPATPETLYHVASVTKPVGATLLLQLVEQGKLDLDEPASRYSAELQGDAVRIKHLLTHTSEGTPGDRFQYSGDNYDHLTAVLEKKTGKPIRALLAQDVLDPLGMAGSVPSHDILEPTAASIDAAHRDRYQKNLQKLAKPYTLYGTEVITTPYPPPNVSAAAGLLSTVLDLARFDAAIDRHHFLRQETQDRAWTRFVSNRGEPLPYGLGWFVEDYHGVKLVWHSGNWGSGFSANYVKVPAKGLTLILLGNSEALSDPASFTEIETYAFACAFLQIFVAEHDCTRATEAATKWLDNRRTTARETIEMDPEVYDAYLGRYELNPKRFFTATREGDRLIMDFDRGEVAELFPEAPDKYFTKGWDIQVTFGRDAKGSVTHLDIVVEGRPARRAKKVR